MCSIMCQMGQVRAKGVVAFYACQACGLMFEAIVHIHNEEQSPSGCVHIMLALVIKHCYGGKVVANVVGSSMHPML